MKFPPVTGFLTSQIGYDLRSPMRALYRAPKRDALPENGRFQLKDLATNDIVLEQPLNYWGECWQSHWWIADFSSLAQAGEYCIIIKTDGESSITSDSFAVDEYLLWKETIHTVAIDQFEGRAEIARFGKGWQDCGAQYREVGSTTGALFGLLDLLNIGFQWLKPDYKMRLAQQVIHGCDYLVSCQQRAADLGFPAGAIIHEMPNGLKTIPQDQGQSVVALAHASRQIYEIDSGRSMDYLNRAAAAYEYYTQQCQPGKLPHFSAMLHGAPTDYQPTSFMSGDLLMMIWGGLELATSGRLEYLEESVRAARELLNRQVAKGAEGELYGHFYAFADCMFTEKAFIHHHVGHDTSMMFNHYIVPLIKLRQQLSEHPDAPRWQQAIHDFAYGYFLPACQSNPFYLLPQGEYGDEGVLTFAGPWHGMNVCYGYAASLAIQLEEYFDDPQFRQIAVGNLQWIAGLNTGFTKDSFVGCVMWRDDIAEGTAVSYSQIHGIGRRAVQAWTKIPGSIGNGFCTNIQFQMKVEPTKANDGPWRYSDEDWIPHAGGWVSGLTYLRQIMGWTVLD